MSNNSISKSFLESKSHALMLAGSRILNAGAKSVIVKTENQAKKELIKLSDIIKDVQLDIKECEKYKDKLTRLHCQRMETLNVVKELNKVYNHCSKTEGSNSNKTECRERIMSRISNYRDKLEDMSEEIQNEEMRILDVQRAQRRDINTYYGNDWKKDNG